MITLGMARLADLRGGIGEGKMADFRQKPQGGIGGGKMADTKWRENTKMAVFDRI